MILPQEKYYGNIEYKRYFNISKNSKFFIKDLEYDLKNYNKTRLDKYTTQLNFRINEGEGSCIYVIGVNDSGSIYGLNDMEIEFNIRVLNYMCLLLKCNITLIIKCRFKEKKFIICKVKSRNYISII